MAYQSSFSMVTSTTAYLADPQSGPITATLPNISAANVLTRYSCFANGNCTITKEVTIAPPAGQVLAGGNVVLNSAHTSAEFIKLEGEWRRVR